MNPCSRIDAKPRVSSVSVDLGGSGTCRGLTPDESTHLGAGWVSVSETYQAAQQSPLDALEQLNEAAQALYAAKRMKRPRNER
jgi:hypothetical protein